ncbi:hypothetical protein Nepgr_013778 [Nepenthes gracilis]|uniref:Uncharacterized protein n=1 Tax=Nepenthes gracilis TaxID=150966 RepID=A0AAD3XNY7_NEPGR|nr:hypothetical protein Nepgr_013778 [Nepenthes gracilis]
MDASLGGGEEIRTLIDYVGRGGIDVGDDLVVLIHHKEYACKRIASLVASPFNSKVLVNMWVPREGRGEGSEEAKGIVVSLTLLLCLSSLFGADFLVFG